MFILQSLDMELVDLIKHPKVENVRLLDSNCRISSQVNLLSGFDWSANQTAWHRFGNPVLIFGFRVSWWQRRTISLIWAILKKFKFFIKMLTWPKKPPIGMFSSRLRTDEFLIESLYGRTKIYSTYRQLDFHLYSTFPNIWYFQKMIFHQCGFG